MKTYTVDSNLFINLRKENFTSFHRLGERLFHFITKHPQLLSLGLSVSHPKNSPPCLTMKFSLRPCCPGQDTLEGIWLLVAFDPAWRQQSCQFVQGASCHRKNSKSVLLQTHFCNLPTPQEINEEILMLLCYFSKKHAVPKCTASRPLKKKVAGS